MESIDKKFDADMVDYNDDTGDVEAWGNIRYENFLDGTKLSCDHLTYNVNTESGIFYNVKGTSEPTIISRPGLLTTSNPFYFEGKWGERVDGKYIVHDGFVTDCKIPKPWWRLTSAKFDILPNDRAITHRAVFHVKKVPIFYFPLYYKSLKKLPRQSGFLTPNIGHSSTYGEMFGLAYYWAISRSYDALYRIQYFTLRGPAHTLELARQGAARHRFQPQPVCGGRSRHQYRQRRDPEAGRRGIHLRRPLRSGRRLDGASASGRAEFLPVPGSLQPIVPRHHLFGNAFGRICNQALVELCIRRGGRPATRNSKTPTPPTTASLSRSCPVAEFLSRDRQILDGVLPVWFSLNSSAGLPGPHPARVSNAHVRQPPGCLSRSSPPRFISPTSVLRASWAMRETEYGDSFVNGVITDQALLRSDREIRRPPDPAGASNGSYQSPKWLGGDKVKHVIEPRVEYKLRRRHRRLSTASSASMRTT